MRRRLLLPRLPGAGEIRKRLGFKTVWYASTISQASETRVVISRLLSCLFGHFLVCLVIKFRFVLAGNSSWWQHLPYWPGPFGPPGPGQAVEQWAATSYSRVQSQPDWATFQYTGTFYLLFILTISCNIYVQKHVMLCWSSLWQLLIKIYN